jgi:uncharacterized membrane protein YsdA (DUF1294 family)
VRYVLGSGLLAVTLSILAYLSLDRLIAWPYYYFTWVLAISLVTFAYYGIDKWLSKAHRFRARVPELILNLLAVFGGAPGAWLGRALFRHKTNLRRHWLMFAILVASSLLEVYVLHTLYSGTLPLG